jgi:hypothetical protein
MKLSHLLKVRLLIAKSPALRRQWEIFQQELAGREATEAERLDRIRNPGRYRFYE